MRTIPAMPHNPQLDQVPSLWRALRAALWHRLSGGYASRHAISAAALERIGQQVRDSERRHGAQVRVVVEARLPPSYLWRYVRSRVPLRRIVRERALMLFGKLRVWDTEHNNGVLIYLLLAQRTLDIVADRGLNAHVTEAQWRGVLARLSQALAAQQFEQGLTQAVQEVSVLLEAAFPPLQGTTPVNELPDAPLRL